MKIAFIEPHLKLVGGIRRILELSNGLVDRGHDVTIYHPSGGPCEWMEGRAKTAPAENVLYQVHDVLVYNDPHSRDMNLAERAQARVKFYYVLILYEMDLLTGIFPRLVRKPRGRTRRLKKCLRSSAIKLVNATWMVDWLSKNMRIQSEVLLGGVNRGMFYPAEALHSNETILILCSGDPRETKGTDVVRKAFDQARQVEPRLVLDTYYGKRIPQNVMATKYSGADIFLDAQRPSGCGWNNPVAEAMACKVPVVCTDIGGVRDFAFHGHTARLVPVDAAEEMAQNVLDLVRQPEERYRLADNGYKQILKFSWEDSARRFEEIALKHLRLKR